MVLEIKCVPLELPSASSQLFHACGGHFRFPRGLIDDAKHIEHCNEKYAFAVITACLTSFPCSSHLSPLSQHHRRHLFECQLFHSASHFNADKRLFLLLQGLEWEKLGLLVDGGIFKVVTHQQFHIEQCVCVSMCNSWSFFRATLSALRDFSVRLANTK